jgi:hypothetical protein
MVLPLRVDFVSNEESVLKNVKSVKWRGFVRTRTVGMVLHP